MTFTGFAIRVCVSQLKAVTVPETVPVTVQRIIQTRSQTVPITVRRISIRIKNRIKYPPYPPCRGALRHPRESLQQQNANGLKRFGRRTAVVPTSGKVK